MKIKQEKLPTRCDVCHQTDLFDASNNVCLRCKDAINEIIKPPKISIARTRRSTLSPRVKDLILGIIVPILCLVCDPMVFTERLNFIRSPLQQYRVFAYLEIAVAIIALVVWLKHKEKLSKWNSLFAIVFSSSAFFALVLGICLLPYTLVGIFVIVGIFGLTPFLAFSVYLRNAKEAAFSLKTLESRSDKISFASGIALGLFLMITPTVIQWHTSNIVSNAVSSILQSNSNSIKKEDIQTLKNAFWCSQDCYDKIVRVYQIETDFVRRDFLAKTYEEITGENIGFRAETLFSD